MRSICVWHHAYDAVLRHYLMISMAHQVNQHAERRLPFNADWEEASLMGGLPAGLVHCLLRLAAPSTAAMI